MYIYIYIFFLPYLSLHYHTSIEYEKKMKLRFIIWAITVILMHLFCWYLVLCFNGVYVNSGTSWLIGCVLSFCLSYICAELVKVLIKSIIWRLSKIGR